jgi:hypothetical protein
MSRRRTLAGPCPQVDCDQVAAITTEQPSASGSASRCVGEHRVVDEQIGEGHDWAISTCNGLRQIGPPSQQPRQGIDVSARRRRFVLAGCRFRSGCPRQLVRRYDKTEPLSATAQAEIKRDYTRVEQSRQREILSVVGFRPSML